MKHIPITVLLFICIAFWVAVLVGLWDANLPEWCAHPERPGNQMVQPFCKGN